MINPLRYEEDNVILAFNCLEKAERDFKGLCNPPKGVYEVLSAVLKRAGLDYLKAEKNYFNALRRIENAQL